MLIYWVGLWFFNSVLPLIAIYLYTKLLSIYQVSFQSHLYFSRYDPDRQHL